MLWLLLTPQQTKEVEKITRVSGTYEKANVLALQNSAQMCSFNFLQFYKHFGIEICCLTLLNFDMT